jgi:hypothetical protein
VVPIFLCFAVLDHYAINPKCEAKHVKKCDEKHESTSEAEYENKTEAEHQRTHHDMSL